MRWIIVVAALALNAGVAEAQSPLETYAAVIWPGKSFQIRGNVLTVGYDVLGCRKTEVVTTQLFCVFETQSKTECPGSAPSQTSDTFNFNNLTEYKITTDTNIMLKGSGGLFCSKSPKGGYCRDFENIVVEKPAPPTRWVKAYDHMRSTYCKGRAF